MRHWFKSVRLIVLGAMGCWSALSFAQGGETAIVSTQSTRSSNGNSYPVAMSFDGMKLLFVSNASNLVPNDTNNLQDLFLGDVRSRRVVNLTQGANGATSFAQMSEDGAVIIAQTEATNLASGTVPAGPKIALYRNNSWQYISLAVNGTIGNGISPSLSSNGLWGAWIRVGHAQNPMLMVYNVDQNRSKAFPLPDGLVPISTHGVSEDGAVLVLANNNGLRTLGLLQTKDGVPQWQFVAEGSSINTPSMSADGHRILYHNGSQWMLYDTLVDWYSTLSINAISAWISPNGNKIQFTGQVDSSSRTILQQHHFGMELTEVVGFNYKGIALPVSEGRFCTNYTGDIIAFSAPEYRLRGWVLGDSNNFSDIIVRIVSEGKTISLTVGAGEQGEAVAGSPRTNIDGSVVVFHSFGSNLVAGDTNEKSDVFIREMSGAVVRIMPSASVQPNGHSYDPVISADGRWVAFVSEATNFPGASNSNGRPNVFLYDRQTGHIRLVSRSRFGPVAANGVSFEPSISADGRYVAFTSGAIDLVDAPAQREYFVYVYDRIRDQVTRVGGAVAPNGKCYQPSISGDGRYLAFVSEATNLTAGDTNGQPDVFIAQAIPQSNGSIQWLVIRRITNGSQQLNGASMEPSMSYNGLRVAFTSEATNLSPLDTDTYPDIYVVDWQTNTIQLVSINSYGVKANLGANCPSISHDGNRIAFESASTNLAVLDNDEADEDIFIYDITRGWLYAVASGCVPGDFPSYRPHLSGNGQYVTFVTNASNLGVVPAGSDSYVALHAIGCVPPGDVNSDGVVDDADLLEVLLQFGSELPSCSDLSMDGIVDDADLLLVLLNFGNQCENPQFVQGGRSPKQTGELGTTHADEFEEEEPIVYRPLFLGSGERLLKRQAAEMELAQRGLWPYPAIGLDAEPWIRLYGDPLRMTPEEILALKDRLNSSDHESDFQTTPGSFSQTKVWTFLNLGPENTVNIKGVLGYSIYADCDKVNAGAWASIPFKLFNLQKELAGAYANASVSRTNNNATFKVGARLMGNTVWSRQHTQNLPWMLATVCNYGGGQQDLDWGWQNQWTVFNYNWLVFTFRVQLGVGFRVGLCYKLHAEAQPYIKAEARARPYVQAYVTGTATVGANVLFAAAEVNLTAQLNLFDGALHPRAIVSLQPGSNNQCCLNYEFGLGGIVSALSGNLRLHGWGRFLFWTKPFNITLFQWNGFNWQGDIVKWNGQHCF